MLKTCFFIGLMTITLHAYAEYYLAYPTPHPRTCCGRVENYHGSSKHGRYSISVYAPCTCEAEWVPGHCNHNGDWTTGRWQEREETVYTYYPDNGYTYDHDMATGDDDVMHYPDMNNQY